MVCPYCGNQQARMVTEIETKTESGGYNVCEGLCCGSVGAVFFGPLGWLFALCGIGEDRTTTRTANLWVCDNCGRRWK